MIGKIKKAWRRWKELRDMPLRLEFVVTDFCNLNCRGCTHFSPLAQREFMPIEDLRHQAEHLGRVCGNGVKQIYLIGGETLLYPELPAAMDILRKAFPNQDLLLFTNGLILGKMDEDFWETARRTGTVIALTRYPVNFNYDAVEDLCRQKGVELQVFGDRSMSNSFFRFGLDPDGNRNKYISHFKCYNRGCVSVVDGFVYPCSISACVKHLNRGAGTNFVHREGDRIPVTDVKNVKQILKLRNNPVPFCSYCKNPPATVQYGPSRRQAAEWVD